MQGADCAKKAIEVNSLPYLAFGRYGIRWDIIHMDLLRLMQCGNATLLKMIPIFQTKFSNEENGIYGNCFGACIASLLEIPINEVPAWEDMGSDGSWADSYYSFLASQGFEADGMILVENGNIDEAWEKLEPADGVNGYFIVGGTSSRCTRGHAVIFKDKSMIHDPHPSNAGIQTIEEIYLIKP